MNILLLNTSERTGGAAVAANRLMKALQSAGVTVNMLVRDKQTDSKSVKSINTSWLASKINLSRFLWERLLLFIYNGFSRKELFKVSLANTGIDVSRHALVKEADIIHLHWINQGFLSLGDIRKLAHLGKPIVWTMHDMWPCTGICHHARDCKRYTSTCGSCFYLGSQNLKDLSSAVFSQKKRLYHTANITFVACSNWLANRAKESALLENKRVIAIPNPIDTTLFHPRNKKAARLSLHLPLDKKLLLFGALNVTDERKGVSYLLDALRLLRNQEVELVVFGQVKKELADKLPLPIHSMGYMADENKIASLYSAVDLFVTSSLEENLPNTIMESMACGTPCVGFRIGGIPEMIDHKVNGYVAKYQSTDDLASGIDWILQHSNRPSLSEACLKKVQANYTEQVVANKYLELYRSLLEQK